jgi:NAD-dependent dihydropyrimidine dehydrogenase PreA subunit
MANRIAVVVSQGQSQNPAKRGLEEDIIASLLMESGLEVTVIPHLYDLTADGTGMLALDGIKGNMIVLSWLYERAARWVLDRNGIRGEEGQTLIRMEDEDEDEDNEKEGADDDKIRVTDQRAIPNRRIYCVDLRVHKEAQTYVDEIKRIADENRKKLVQLGDWIQGDPSPDAMQRFEHPTNDTALGGGGLPIVPASPLPTADAGTPTSAETIPTSPSSDVFVADVVRIEEDGGRRWYPVIDFSRCTNCMECIDFCLFGVYGVDGAETILVEQPDNCRKGCPACSRVCPENAIIFPQHKTPAIAGSPATVGGMKIDLSRLFGSPDTNKSAVEIAALERDEQLMMAGRETVGMSVGIRKRQADQPVEPKDELDDLIDALDDLDL